MVRLEHANLVVNDIEPTLAFLKAAFPHWQVRASGPSIWYGKPRKWLHFGDDYTYITLNDNGDGVPRDLAGHAPGLAHLGFIVTNIDRLIERLKRHGYTPSVGLDTVAHRRNVYFIDPAGLEFEFVEYLSDDPAERNVSEEC
ncbi:MAG: glyoxalase [Robiginitomaculum sp.]|nr:MAG: glyoxalase [Robiginitomaculum sp.]